MSEEKNDHVATCPICNDVTFIDILGLCIPCSNQGFWIDPAGGIHAEDDNPALKYE